MTKLASLLFVPAMLISSFAAACDGYGNCYAPSYYTPSYSSYGYSQDYQQNYHSCSYSTWTYQTDRGYNYCTCSFRPTYDAPYSQYICVCYPNNPRYVYYYNPVQKQYWGRYDSQVKGFQTLAATDRRPTIAELPEANFSAPATSVALPESQIGELVVAPAAPAASAEQVAPATTPNG